MKMSFGQSVWKCPKCGDETVLDGAELAQIGQPYCSECADENEREVELEPQDTLVPTLCWEEAWGAERELAVIAMRPAGTKKKAFLQKLNKVWTSLPVKSRTAANMERAVQEAGIAVLLVEEVTLGTK